MSHSAAQEFVRVPLTKQEQDRLGRFAIRFGFSLPEFSRRILSELVTEIEEEALGDYEKPARLTQSLARAVRDWKNGKVFSRL